MSEYNYRREAVAALKEIADESQKRTEVKEQAARREFEQTREDVMSIKEHAAFLKERKEQYHHKVLNEMMGTALKAIYISAIQKDHSLTESDIHLAENMVDRFVKEHGGASTMIRSMQGTTYVKDFITGIVEDAAEEAEANATDEEKEFEEVPEEPREEMLDKMEKEDSVDSAVEMIASRIATAEEEFIKKNKEDREKIEAIVADVNQRIEAVKADPTTSDEVKAEEEEDLTQEMTRMIRDLDYRRSTPIYEFMMKSIGASIMKDKDLREVYCVENGKIDMDMAITTGTVLYGFLEFVNTLQLEKIDINYIKDIVTNFNK